MTDPVAGGSDATARRLQEHHEGWAPDQPLPAEPVLLTVQPGAGTAPRGTAPAGPGQAPPPAVSGHKETPRRDQLSATAGYVAVIFGWLLAPLAVYLIAGRRSEFVRRHAAQAFSLTLTVTLFACCGGIVGVLLTLNSLRYAILIMGPVMFVFWLVALWYLVRAASAASRGQFYPLPSWICVPTLR